jgi:hypothetical protein
MTKKYLVILRLFALLETNSRKSKYIIRQCLVFVAEEINHLCTWNARAAGVSELFPSLMHTVCLIRTTYRASALLLLQIIRQTKMKIKLTNCNIPVNPKFTELGNEIVIPTQVPVKYHIMEYLCNPLSCTLTRIHNI